HFNRELFDGTLPDVFIVYQRKPGMSGHFAADRYSARVGKFGKDELALNPDDFVGKTDKQINQTLNHEMCHVWRKRCCTLPPPKRATYHDQEWADKMKEIGLQPSSTGMVGGKETGQRMSDYIIPGGAFEQAHDKLAATGWKLNLESAHRPAPKGINNSKTKFTCRVCGQNVWGKPDTRTLCLFCFAELAERRGITVDVREVTMFAADVPAAVPSPSYEPEPPPVPAYEPEPSPPLKRGRPKGLKDKIKAAASQSYDTNQQ